MQTRRFAAVLIAISATVISAAAPVSAATTDTTRPPGSCTIGMTVQGIGVGVDVKPSGVTACAWEDSNSGTEAGVDAVAFTPGSSVLAGGGSLVCRYDPSPTDPAAHTCVYAGASGVVDVIGDNVALFASPTVCTDHYVSFYSHCVTVFAFAYLDGPQGSKTGVTADVFVCDQSATGFTCPIKAGKDLLWDVPPLRFQGQFSRST
jgi:hypothetical protein